MPTIILRLLLRPSPTFISHEYIRSRPGFLLHSQTRVGLPWFRVLRPAGWSAESAYKRLAHSRHLHQKRHFCRSPRNLAQCSYCAHHQLHHHLCLHLALALDLHLVLTLQSPPNSWPGSWQSTLHHWSTRRPVPTLHLVLQKARLYSHHRSAHPLQHYYWWWWSIAAASSLPSLGAFALDRRSALAQAEESRWRWWWLPLSAPILLLLSVLKSTKQHHPQHQQQHLLE
mgnify:CR=1 FL=1